MLALNVRSCGGAEESTAIQCWFLTWSHVYREFSGLSECFTEIKFLSLEEFFLCIRILKSQSIRLLSSVERSNQ